MWFGLRIPKEAHWPNSSRNRRFGTIEELREETRAWHEHINDRQRGVEWQLKLEDARVNLKSLYPKIEV